MSKKNCHCPNSKGGVKCAICGHDPKAAGGKGPGEAGSKKDLGMGALGKGSQGTGSQGYGGQGTGSFVKGSLGKGSQGAGSQGYGSQGYGSQGTGSLGKGSQGAGSHGYGGEGTGSLGKGGLGKGSQGAGSHGCGCLGTRSLGKGGHGTGSLGKGGQGAGSLARLGCPDRGDIGRGLGEGSVARFGCPDGGGLGKGGPGKGGVSTPCFKDKEHLRDESSGKHGLSNRCIEQGCRAKGLGKGQGNKGPDVCQSDLGCLDWSKFRPLLVFAIGGFLTILLAAELI